MRANQYYGLAFYSDVHDLTLDGGTSGTETASTVNLVASIVNSDVASGVDSVVEIGNRAFKGSKLEVVKWKGAARISL